MPRLVARWMIVEAIVEAASSSGISATNERSIFSRSTGIRHSRASDEWPVPKSSIAIRKPCSFSASSTACVRAGSAITVDSVISTIIRRGSTPATRAARSVLSTKSGCQSWRSETLKATSSSSPFAAQAAAWRHDSSHHPLADRLDQAGLLGERDEVERGHEPAVGVLPADQRLDADHRHAVAARLQRGVRACQVDDRLVVEDELVPVDGLAQAGDHLEPLLDGLGAGGEHPRGRRAGLLRLVVRRVGVLEEHARLVRVEREDADARTGAHEQLGAVDRERARERGVHALGDRLGRRGQPAGALRGLRVADVQVGQQNEELVGAVARDDVARASDPDEPLGHAAEELVGGVVAEAAVDEPEALEVDVDQRDGHAAAARARERCVELVLERAARREPGERIALGRDAAGGQHRLAQEAGEARPATAARAA